MWISFLVVAQWCSRNTDFRVVNSRTQQEGYVFAPATLSNIYGFLAINSRFTASGDGVAQLGRSLDVDSNTNGQVVIDSVINEGFNMAKPWADLARLSQNARLPVIPVRKMTR